MRSTGSGRGIKRGTKMNDIRATQFRAASRRWLSSRRLGSLVFAWTVLSSASTAWAACKAVSGLGTTVFNLDMGTIVIPPDTAVGQRIAPEKRFSRVASDTLIGTCSSQGHIFREMTQGAPVAGLDGVYSTNVKGIGVRLTFKAEGDPFFFPKTFTYSGNRNVYMYASSYYLVELIKTEAVTGSGPLTSGEVGRSRFDSSTPYASIFIPANGVTVVTPSCTVDTGSRNILVQLGKVPTKSFSGVGSTAGARPFNIKLNCSAGVEAANTVFLRMDATADPSGQQGVLQVTQGGGMATGVGIQVLDGSSTGVRFGEDALVGPSKDGSYVVPFTARYFQTAPTITAGPANGMATFSLNYK